jgi:ABC-type transport system involved in cytochrome c biogenesis permease subunit
VCRHGSVLGGSRISLSQGATAERIIASMPPEFGRITVFCFAASYAVAAALELVHQFRPRPALRWLALGFAAAGLFAHTLFLAVNPLPLQAAFGSLIFLAWIVAVFCLYGTIHHPRLAWGLFVWPLVLGLIVLAEVTDGPPPRPSEPSWELFPVAGKEFWPIFHGALMLLAAVGVCVGFVASIMYLVQTHRLKTKQSPGRGPRLWNLERLELMNRRAIVIAFPLLTLGLLVAAGQLLAVPGNLQELENWKVISTALLWLVFVILLYLRYGVHAGGRRVALLTIVAFTLMLFALVAVHPFAQGGAR